MMARCAVAVAPSTHQPFNSSTLVTTVALFAFIVATILGVSAATTSEKGPAPSSEWVPFDAKGHLLYKALPAGDRIMDFSFAGYQGGGVAFPVAPVKQTVKPCGGDDAAAIQDALNTVAKMSDAGGLRGAVLLAPGAFQCSRTLVLDASGVVLRGSGSGADGTTLEMTGAPHVCISIRGAASTRQNGRPVAIADAYVPSGVSSFNIADVSGFKVGDTVVIRRPVTSAWVSFMGMDKLVRNGKKETWVSGELRTERVIRSITGERVTLDMPLTDSLDARYLNPPGASLVKWDVTGRISQVGVESLRIAAPPQSVEISERHHQAIRAGGATDIWIKDLEITDTVNSVGISASRATVENVRIRHTVATKGSAKPADFSADGSQILFDRCSAVGTNLFYFVTGARVTGPVVLLNCAFSGGGWIQPHARWATGLLVDNCRVPEGGIDFMNRGEMGSGHGWTIGWAVAWNCVAKEFTIQQPPGAANWAIGCQGERRTAVMPFGHPPALPEGLFDSHGKPVAPASLYLAQLRERLGEAALKQISH